MGQHYTPKALKALQGSIQKWENIAAGKTDDRGSKNCPLCKMFLKSDVYEKECAGCPVMKATGEPHCDDSPYTRKWARAQGGDWAMTDEQVLAARAEADFLRSLLPKKLRPKVIKSWL